MSELIFYVPATILVTVTVAMVYFEFRMRREPGQRALTVLCRLSETQSETLRHEASRLGIAPTALASAVLTRRLASDLEANGRPADA